MYANCYASFSKESIHSWSTFLKWASPLNPQEVPFFSFTPSRITCQNQLLTEVSKLNKLVFCSKMVTKDNHCLFLPEMSSSLSTHPQTPSVVSTCYLSSSPSSPVCPEFSVILNSPVFIPSVLKSTTRLISRTVRHCVSGVMVCFSKLTGWLDRSSRPDGFWTSVTLNNCALLFLYKMGTGQELETVKRTNNSK